MSLYLLLGNKHRGQVDKVSVCLQGELRSDQPSTFETGPALVAWPLLNPGKDTLGQRYLHLWSHLTITWHQKLNFKTKQLYSLTRCCVSSIPALQNCFEEVRWLYMYTWHHVAIYITCSHGIYTSIANKELAKRSENHKRMHTCCLQLWATAACYIPWHKHYGNSLGIIWTHTRPGTQHRFNFIQHFS